MIRVATQDPVSFGNVAEAVTASHLRYVKGADAIIGRLVSPVRAAAGAELVLPSGYFDILYPSGDLPDAHLRALVGPYWDGQPFTLDLLVDAATPVAVAGYAAATYANWSITVEPD